RKRAGHFWRIFREGKCAANLSSQRIAIDVILPQQSRRNRAAAGDDAQQKMLSADKFLIQRPRLMLRRLQRRLGRVAEGLMHRKMITLRLYLCRIFDWKSKRLNVQRPTLNV